MEVVGLELLFGVHHRVYRRAEDYRLKKFTTHYGKNPRICSILWKEIIRDKWILRKTKGKPKVKHFLWGMHFMHVYDTEAVSSTTFDCDEKTWRKWTWVYAEAVSRLAPKLVSIFDFI